ncbi:MFS transporter [Nitratireductor thuwali]|uniref:MFS-type transporter YhjX n=1 Tax=Nitratireductor thuwali TaxID=2267699 RepID=A0ABY5MMK2_9HYPH|nr:putative MFS-type transporter YhjX [Nitratireductor thuwali]
MHSGGAALPDSERLDSTQSWVRLALCILLGTIGSVALWAYIVVLPRVQADFGVDRAAASLPYTTVMMGFALGNVVIGRYADRIGVALPVAIAGTMLGLGYILSSFSQTIWQFALAQGLLVGVGASATFGPLIADISHWFKKRRGIAVAAVASGNYVAGVVWPTVIKLLLAGTGWRLTFLWIGIFCILSLVPLSLLLRTRPPSGVDPAPPAATLSGAPRRTQPFSPNALQALLIVAGLGCCVAMSMPQVHIVAYCVDLGYGIARGAEMLSLMLAGGIVSRLASGFLADHIGGVRTLIIGSVMQCLALVLYIPFDGLASLYIVSLVFGLSQGGIVPSYAIIVREYLPAREAGQRVGIVIMATIVGMALGGWMSGWIYDMTGSYGAAFLNGIGWNLLNISVMVLILLRGRRVREATA